jgi:hypothetical protein
MIEPYPGAAPNAPHGLVVLEGHKNPVHGDIVKNDYIYHRNEEQEVQIPVIPVKLPEI